jgi:hypothetical protein
VPAWNQLLRGLEMDALTARPFGEVHSISTSLEHTYVDLLLSSSSPYTASKRLMSAAA